MTTTDPLVLVLQGSAVSDIPSFYAEINRVFMADEDWQLGHSLDALDDMLYGGYGVLAGHESATVIWQDIEYTRGALGVDANRAWLQSKIAGSRLFNRPTAAAHPKTLNAGEGQTYFQIVMEIFPAHLQLTLVRD